MSFTFFKTEEQQSLLLPQEQPNFLVGTVQSLIRKINAKVIQPTQTKTQQAEEEEKLREIVSRLRGWNCCELNSIGESIKESILGKKLSFPTAQEAMQALNLLVFEKKVTNRIKEFHIQGSSSYFCLDQPEKGKDVILSLLWLWHSSDLELVLGWLHTGFKYDQLRLNISESHGEVMPVREVEKNLAKLVHTIRAKGLTIRFLDLLDNQNLNATLYER